jgi:hypothetical protein
MIGRKPSFARDIPLHPWAPRVSNAVTGYPAAVSLATDNWPFFYMPVRKYPWPMASALLLILAASWLMIRALLAESKPYVTPVSFLLGAGFMLMETSAITRLALQFGNTWMVATVVISVVLGLGALANLCVIKRMALSIPRTYACLVFFLLVGLAPDSALSGLPLGVNRAAETLLQLFPLFFAAMAFSQLLAGPASIGQILSSNILGAMCGGMLEYSVMVLGFRSLIFFAMALYLGAGFLHCRFDDHSGH